jgi:HEAT repeat protein
MLYPSVRLLNGRPSRVERLRRKGNAEGLVRVLTYEDLTRDREGQVVDLGAPLRKAAVEALATLDAPAARDGLVRALRDPEEIVRLAAIQALCERDYAKVREPVTAVVTHWTGDEHVRVREHALESLASVADPNLPRTVAAAMLSRPAELDDADGKVLRRLVEAGGPEAARSTVDDLIAVLLDGPQSPRVRTMLAWLAPESVEPLVQVLDERQAEREAALTLGAIHDSRATEALCFLLLEGDNPSVRAAAAWALGEIKDPAAVKSLLRASGDDDYAVRAETIEAFEKLGNVAVATAMSIHVRAALEDGAVRPAATLGEDGAGSELPPSPAVPPSSTLGRRARPMLRRLLGEPPG